MRNRRVFTPQFKAQVVLEVLSGVKSQATACRETTSAAAPLDTAAAGTG